MSVQAVRRAEELQEDLIILQNAKDTLEKQLAARGHIAARVSAGEDDLEEALRLVAKPVDSTQLCSLGCGRLLPLERVSVRKTLKYVALLHQSSKSDTPFLKVSCSSYLVLSLQ